MTDDRPPPKYGQYAPIPPPSAAPVEATPLPVAEAVQPPAAPVRRTWDIALTTGLLLVGVYDVVGSFSRFADLGAALREAYEQQGIGTFTADELATTAGLVINVSRAILLVLAVGLSLWRISRNRVAFWIPLAAGVLSGLIVLVGVLIVVLGDPAFAAYVAQQAAVG